MKTENIEIANKSIIYVINYNYDDHLDTECVKPDRLCRALLISAHIYLGVSYFSWTRDLYGLCAANFLLYLTSLWHWHRPRKTAIARKVDIFVVLSTIIYGTVYAFLWSNITFLWLCCLFVLTVGYITNAIVTYYRCELTDAYLLDKKISVKNDRFDVDEYYSFINNSDDKTLPPVNSLLFRILSTIFNLEPTWPMTEEREWANKCDVYTHGVIAHLLPGGLAIFCLLVGRED